VDLCEDNFEGVDFWFFEGVDFWFDGLGGGF
jgi:hypothetical protein